MARQLLWLCILMSAFSFACGGDEQASTARRLQPAAQGLDAEGQMHPGPEDRCPVCAMLCADKKMLAGIELKAGGTHYFCGPRCMLLSYLRPEQYLQTKATSIARAVVTEYFSGRQLDAKAVHWVAGSDLTGPMGQMIVPVLGDEALQTFRKRHGGEHVFRLEELDLGLWQKIIGKKGQGVPSK